MVLSILFALGSAVTSLGAVRKAGSLMVTGELAYGQYAIFARIRERHLGVQGKSEAWGFFELKEEDLPPSLAAYASKYVFTDSEWSTFLLKLEHRPEDPEKFDQELGALKEFSDRRRQDMIIRIIRPKDTE